MRVSTTKNPFPLIFISLLSIGILIIFIPPQNIGVIFSFLFFVSILVYSVSRLFLTRRLSILISIFLSSSLFLLAADLFDTINAILLVSLFVGLFILFK